MIVMFKKKSGQKVYIMDPANKVLDHDTPRPVSSTQTGSIPIPHPHLHEEVAGHFLE